MLSRRTRFKFVSFATLISLVACAAYATEEEVVVRGRHVTRVADEEEVSSTVVEGETLRRPGLQATDVLAETPGVQVQRTGTGADTSTVSVRGLSSSQVPVYVSGIRLNDDFVGVADLSRIPLWMMHRVSVHRTASPLHAPRAGLAGAVVFEPRLPHRSELRVGGLAGSYSTGALWAGVGVAHGKPSEPGQRFSGATNISIRREGAENDFTYLDDGGTAFDSSDDLTRTRLNADARSDDIWAISRLRFGNATNPTRLTLLANGYRRKKGVSSLALLPALSSREELERGLFGLTVQAPCGNGCEIYSTTSASHTELFTTDPDDELRLGSVWINQDSSRISNQLGVQVSPIEEVRLRGSVVYELSRIGKDLERSGGPDVRGAEKFFGLIASGRFAPTDVVLLRGEVRASCARAIGYGEPRFDGGSPSEEWNLCIPEGRLGGRLSVLSGLAIRASGVRGVRMPTLGERFGLSATTRGNPDLEVERAWSGEMGLAFERDVGRQTFMTVDLSGFYRRARELVAYRRASQGYVRPYNVGEARVLGAEMASTISTLNHLRISNGLSLLQAQDVTDRPRDLPFRAAITWQGGLEAYWKRVSKIWSHIAVGFVANYRAGRVSDPAGLIVIPEQWVFDLSGRVEVKKRLNVRMRLSNVFDQARFDTVGFPLPGRALLLSAEIVTN